MSAQFKPLVALLNSKALPRTCGTEPQIETKHDRDHIYKQEIERAGEIEIRLIDEAKLAQTHFFLEFDRFFRVPHTDNEFEIV